MSRPARIGLWVLLGLAALLSALGWWSVDRVLQGTGKTPAEVLDHLERRLQGHTRLEVVGLPVIGWARAALDAPSRRELAATEMAVPPPPPRRGPQDVGSSDPVPPGATVWRVGPKGPLLRISDAAERARDGDVVEIEAGDYHGDVAVWNQKRLTIRGVGGAARLHAAGRIAEGKAIWVFRRGEFDVRHIDFIGARAGDANGAGIRFEGGRLRLRDCLFWDNQMGLLTADRPHAEGAVLEIEGSEFAYSHVKGRWGHNLYVGTIERLTVKGSYFHHAGRGHLLKSRARVNEILFNRLTDEAGGRASYEANFPNGGEVLMLGNTVQQQPGTENGVLVSYGEEGYTWPSNRLTLASNTLVNDVRAGGALLRTAPGPVSVFSHNNLLVGHGGYLVPQAVWRHNDLAAEWADLVLPVRHDYRVTAPARARLAYRAPAPGSAGTSPEATAQYVHPLRVEGLRQPPAVVGADQRPSP